MKQLAEGGQLDPAKLAELARQPGNCKGGNMAASAGCARRGSSIPRCSRNYAASAKSTRMRWPNCWPPAMARAFAWPMRWRAVQQARRSESWARQCGHDLDRWPGPKRYTIKEKVLPPGAVASIKDSTLQGVSVGDPTADTPGEEFCRHSARHIERGAQIAQDAGDPARAPQSGRTLFCPRIAKTE